MLRNLIVFHDLAQQVVKETPKSTNKITWWDIRTNFDDLLRELSSMKFKVKFFLWKSLSNKSI